MKGTSMSHDLNVLGDDDQSSNLEIQPPKPAFKPEWRWIDPEYARNLLERNPRNRGKRRDWINVLAQQIKRDEYRPTHQGIAIDEMGNLVDGQHRLEAIVEANKGVWMLMTCRIPDDSMLAIDRGRVRHDRDNIRVALGIHISASTYTVARAMIDGMEGSRNGSAVAKSVTGETIVDFIDKNEDAIEFANRGSNKKCNPTIFRATIARAYYHVDESRLTEFRDIVVNELVPSGEQDSAAYRLKTYIKENANQFSTWDGWRSLAQFTTWALIQFIDRRSIKRLDRTTKDPWPLPRDRWPESVDLSPKKKNK